MILGGPKKTWYVVGMLLTYITCRPAFRVSLFGTKNVPKKGAALFLCNHQSFIDPVFSQMPIHRVIHFVARDSLFKVKFLGPLISSFGVTPIKR